MYNSDTDLLFPLRVIPSLRNLKGTDWQELIDRVVDGDATEQQAFVLMMVRLCGCTACDADSFRAMRGCSQCSRLTIKRYRGTDGELITQFETHLKEIMAYYQKLTSGK